MVLITRLVTCFPDEKHGFAIEANAPKEKITDTVLQIHLVGLINAISGLSEYANDIFTSILKESTGITERIMAIGERCNALSQNVASVEQYNQRITLSINAIQSQTYLFSMKYTFPFIVLGVPTLKHIQKHHLI